MKKYTVKELIEQSQGYRTCVFVGKHEAFSGPSEIHFVTFDSVVQASKLSNTWSIDANVSFLVEMFYDDFQPILGGIIYEQTKKENMKIQLDKI